MFNFFKNLFGTKEVKKERDPKFVKAELELNETRRRLRESDNIVIKERGTYQISSGKPVTRTETKDEGDFVLSAAVAAATDSSLLGFVVGGDLGGALLGDMLNSSDSSSSYDSSSSSFDSSSDSSTDWGGDGGGFGGGGASGDW